MINCTDVLFNEFFGTIVAMMSDSLMSTWLQLSYPNLFQLRRLTIENFL